MNKQKFKLALAFLIIIGLLAVSLRFAIYINDKRTWNHILTQDTTSLLKDFSDRISQEKVAMNDEHMLHVLRRVITQPAQAGSQRLTKKFTGSNSQYGQSEFVDRLLNYRANGFFVECGASDGETLSNSIFFELLQKWSGLLVEVNPRFYSKLLKTNRHAYSLNACLSPSSSPQTLNVRPYDLVGGLTEFMEPAHLDTVHRLKLVNITALPEISVICYPLYSIMLSIGRTHIDYLSLDVEGAELPILKTIPLDKLFIDVILVEYMVWGSDEATAKKLTDVRQFFNSTQLYKEVGILGEHDVAFKRITWPS